MGERTQYHHGDLRTALVREATRRIQKAGDSSLSLRACARSLGVDVAAAYRHFKNKQAVLAAVAAASFEELATEMLTMMEGAGRGEKTAKECFIACGAAYIGYGIRHPHLYRLMFGGRCDLSAVQKIRNQRSEETPNAFALLEESLQWLDRAGLIASGARDGAALVAWAQVHGLVTLSIEELGDPSRDTLELFREQHAPIILAGLQATR